MKLVGNSFNEKIHQKKTTIHVCSVHQLGDNRINRHINTLLKFGYNVKYSNISKSKSKINNKAGLIVEHYDYNCNPRENPFSYLKTLILLSWSILCTRSSFVHLHDVYLLPLVLIAKITGKKVIYDKHEFYETEASLIGKISRVFDGLFARFIDGVVMVSEAQLKYLIEKKYKNIVCIPNYQSKDIFLDKARCSVNKQSSSQIHLVYFGSLSETDRNIIFMLEIADILLSQYSNVIFELGGETKEKVVLDKIAEMKDKNERFIYYGYMEHDFVIERTLSSDIGFLLFKDTPNTINCSPNKVFEYLMAGVVVIGMGGGEAFNLVNQNNCGRVFGFNDSKDMVVDYLGTLLNDRQKLKEMKENSRKIGMNYSWEGVEERYRRVYENILL